MLGFMMKYLEVQGVGNYDEVSGGTKLVCNENSLTDTIIFYWNLSHV